MKRMKRISKELIDEVVEEELLEDELKRDSCDDCEWMKEEGNWCLDCPYEDDE